MYKRILILAQLLFLCVSMLYGQTSENSLELEAGIAFNRSNFSWSIAGNLDGESPNILSELKFKKIASLGYYLRGNYTPINHLTFSTYYQRNSVFEGYGSDTDYEEDNRTNPTFEEAFSSDKGHLTILKGGIGSAIYISKKMEIIPSLSYYSKKQKFYLLSHRERDLRSTYLAHIQGVEISMTSNIFLSQSVLLSFALNYQFVDYKAEANWNLRDIFQHPLSFAQDAKGAGLGLDAAVEYYITKRLSAVISGGIHTTTIREGTDTAYLITGKKMKTQFNGADNVLYGLSMGIAIVI